MARLSINELKARFATTDQPTQKDYADLIDTLLANLTSATLNPGGAYFYAAAVLSTDTYVASYIPSVTAYMDGTVLAFKADVINPTGGTKFDAGNGAAELVKENDLPLAKGDIQAHQIVEVRFNGTTGKWQILSRLTKDGGKPGDIVVSATDSAQDASRLLCDGTAYNQSDYPGLFQAIGTNFGVGGAGTFKVPDLRGRTTLMPGTLSPSGRIVNWKDVLGEDKHHLLIAEMPAHAHNDGSHKYLLRPPYVGSLTGSDTVNSGTEQAVGAGDGASITTQGTDTPHENLPPIQAFFYYILT